MEARAHNCQIKYTTFNFVTQIPMELVEYHSYMNEECPTEYIAYPKE